MSASAKAKTTKRRRKPIIVGTICTVTYDQAMDDKEHTVVKVVRVGRIATVHRGRIEVKLSWGEVISADVAQVEVHDGR